MTTRLRELAKGLGACLTLAALLVIPPVGLTVTVGWPLPRALPSWAQLSEALGGSSVPDGVLLKTLATCCWVAWALLLISVVSESVAWTRGYAARPLAATRGFQPLTRRLVTAATLVFSLSRSAVPSVTLPAVVPAVATVPGPEVFAAEAEPVPAVPALPSCTVQPRDSLWRLAEEHLGDGLRWREIWELNRGRTQSDGRVFSEPNLIRPGWELTMPADSVGLPQDVPEDPVPSAVPPAAPSAPPSIVTTTPSTAPSAAAPLTTLPGTTEAIGVPTSASSPDHAADSSDDPDYEVVPLLAGAALVAAGVVTSLDRRRRRRRGHRAVRPSPELRPTEVSLRRAADERGYTRLDLVMRNLANQLASGGAAPPPVDVVSVSPGAVEVLLSDVSDAPEGPFEVTAEGQAWTLHSAVDDGDLTSTADASAGPVPALAAIGTIDDRTVLVDLESAPCTVVNGDPDDALDLLWTIALDLATSERADDIDILVVGEVPLGLDLLDRVRVEPSLEVLLPELERFTASIERDLGAMRVGSAYEARLRGLGDSVAPTIVIVPSAHEEPLDRLVALARRRAGVAVLAMNDGIDAERELCVEGDTLVVKPLGLRLAPSVLPTETTVWAAALVAEAGTDGEDEALDLRDHTGDAPALVGPDALPSADFDLVHDDHGRPVVPEGHVVVRVHGGVEIFGGERPVDRRRSVELVVYLALHPDGVDEEQIREALWPEDEPSRSAFNETVSRARRSLGLDPTGEHHVRHIERGRYHLGPYVHVEMHRPVGRGEQLALPFRGCRGYEWAYAEGIAYALEAAVTDHARTA